MRILFDIGHPAHVHFLKNFIQSLNTKENRLCVVSRDKDVTCALLNHYHIHHHPISRVGKTLFGLMAEMIIRNLRVLSFHHQYRFDVAFGTSYSIAHLSAVSSVRSYVFEEDDDDIVPIFTRITYPFTTGIIVPSCLRYDRWKDKRIIHNSYHELAYLHPDHFTPDINILKKYKLKPKEYIILRKNELKAHHDIGISGLDKEIWEDIFRIIKGYKILKSYEGSRNYFIEPWDMHHILYFAKMLISDSQTMTAEAAVLGVPSVRYNSFVGKITYLEELEHDFGLTFGYQPGDRRILKKVKEFSADPGIENEWQRRKDKMIEEKVNFHEWMHHFFDNL